MNHCATAETTTCSYLGTLGCELPGWKEKMERLAFLESKVLHGTASHEQTLEYRSLFLATDPIANMQETIYLGSCFCNPAFR